VASKSVNKSFILRVSFNWLILYLPLLVISILSFYFLGKSIKERQAKYLKSKQEVLSDAYVGYINSALSASIASSNLILDKNLELRSDTVFIKALINSIHGINEIHQYRILNSEGQELIRIERNIDSAYSAPLQNKAHRDYFKRGIQMELGQICFSKMNLNIENKRIEQPLRPVLRCMIRLDSKNTKNKALLVVNISLKPLLKRINFYCINGHQWALISPNNKLLFYSEEPDNYSHFKDFYYQEKYKQDFRSNNGFQDHNDNLSYTQTIEHQSNLILGPIWDHISDAGNPLKYKLKVIYPQKSLANQIKNYRLALIVLNLIWGLSAIFFSIYRVNVNKRLRHKKELLLAQNKELEQNRKTLVYRNNRLTEFSHIITHNLRGPIASLQLYSESLSKYKDPDKREELNSRLLKVVRNLMGTMEDLREYLGLIEQDIKPEDEVELSKIIEQVEGLLHHKFVQHRVELRLDLKVERIKSHHPTLLSILQNLIDNAIKYRKEEGETYVAIRTYKNMGKTIIEVEDNGIGIDIQRHRHGLFKLYKRFHKGRSGKGVGLFLVKSQVEMLGGSLEVKSTVNQGTIFRIQL